MGDKTVIDGFLSGGCLKFERQAYPERVGAFAFPVADERGRHGGKREIGIIPVAEERGRALVEQRKSLGFGDGESGAGAAYQRFGDVDVPARSAD